MSVWRVTTCPELPSTMDWVRDRYHENAPDFTAVRAVTQSGGRGRRGRVWMSPPGNLYFSFLLRAHDEMLPLLLGLALHDVLRPLVPDDVSVEVKWPNDVLVDGRKIAGILVEREGDASIVGIGVNIESAPEERACLSEWNAALDAEHVLTLLEHAILDLYDRNDPAHIRDRWNAAAAWKNLPISFQHGGNTVFGVFEGVDEKGHALLRDGSGVKAYASGEVMEVRPTV